MKSMIAWRELPRLTALVTVLSCTIFSSVSAQDGGVGEDLAKKLSNPIASLISVPIQSNYDAGYGPNDGWRLTTNIQPVIPISISEDWNLISRTILPVIAQDDIAGPSGHQFGLGDVVQSAFFSPKEPTSGGLIWGVGPVLLLPTGTDDLLGAGKFGIGPTGVALTQRGPWTVGMLANHIWSVFGEDHMKVNGVTIDRPDVSTTFMQPFLSYTTPDAWTFSLNTETAYDWEAKEWSVPVNVVVSKLLRFGNQPVSVGAGVRYWADSTSTGPEGFGARFQVTFLFPK